MAKKPLVPKPVFSRRRGSGWGSLAISLGLHLVCGGLFVFWKLGMVAGEGAEARPKEFVVKMAEAKPVRIEPARARLPAREQLSQRKAPSLSFAPKVDVKVPSVSFATPTFSRPSSSEPAGLVSRGGEEGSAFSELGQGSSETGVTGGTAPSGPSQIGSEGSAGYVGSPRLDYPAAARRLGLEGRCVLQLTIGADGALQEVAVTVSSGHKLLDEAALRCARDCRYYAAQVGTEKVRSVVVWPFVFKLTQ